LAERSFKEEAYPGQITKVPGVSLSLLSKKGGNEETFPVYFDSYIFG